MICSKFPAIKNEGGITASGFTTTDTLAYAWDGNELVTLERSQFSRGTVRVPTVRGDNVRYWLSSTNRAHRPEDIVPVGSNDLLAGAGGDLVVIGHPAFLPLSPDEAHPLNDYLENRRAEGWDPVVFDIDEIQRHFGFGMQLPDAVNAFLAAADERFEFDHVLLVGSDSYDYNDNFGLGSVSFIPTHYASTRIVNYTPSDALLTDLDGDGLGDKAIGRWPVRTFGDLQATVTKVLDWTTSAGLDQSAIWATDRQDPNVLSFRGQGNRMFDLLADAGWSESDLERVFWEGETTGDAVRAELFAGLEQGRSLTGFSGHGSPALWGRSQALLLPTDLDELHNEGKPTLIGTLTCYTSYFVSPFNDTVAHRWMNGYREDPQGNQIPGVANGAVAIHGASTLSNYAQNEVFAKKVLEYQLEGATLGEAVRIAREEASEQGIDDLVINWILLGDPTLRMGEIQ